MSRSRKKTKIFGNAGRSDKTDKRMANRKLRRLVNSGKYELNIRDVSNVWNFSKDGKHYYDNAGEEDMRK